MHIAQANVSYLLAPIDDPKIAGFVARLDEINQLADVSPGFVWRFITDSRVESIYEDRNILFNMTVWESLEALHAFTYRTAHAELFAARKQWFAEWKHAIGGSSFALWWVEPGALPTAEEGKARLRTIQQHGPTPYAFTFKQTFPPGDCPIRE